uniref:DNA replication licensing factor MCM7 n=1 Tax=Dunaliella tertiolecta TaxID=3047 RepID=A0A7S3QKH7_DUNTE
MESAGVNYEEETARCELFLKNYMDPNTNDLKYAKILQSIANRETRRLIVELDDVEDFFDQGDHAAPKFISNIESNTKRYLALFASAASAALPKPNKTDLESDIFDVLASHRAQHGGGGEGQAGVPAATALPPALLRRFDVYFKPRAKMGRQPMRSVNAAHIGHIVKLKGTITNVSDVKPLVTVAAYTDVETGHELYQEVLGRSFTPLDAQDPYQKKKIPPALETRGCRFTRFQEARLQEAVEEVPEGSTPRTMRIHFRGPICRSVKAGDEVIMTGVFLPEPYTGFKAMRAGLLTNTFVEAMEVEQLKTSYAESVLSRSDLQKIAEIRARSAQGGSDVFKTVALSIAPEIFGHEDVKKALLLSMVGGCTRVLPDGMKLRGDVHVCLMGDPGVAKSQLLKYVTRISPRSVYTTGKGSSGVGLTAAVMRNQLTKELVLEGGALVLADKGICCIDEFDKMDESDRTAIHEVMEQQTVSIAKAGITTTLNTRTTLMAAANPAWGRYDKKRTPAENINLPAALLSRFDILWLMLDEVSDEGDRMLAEHVLTVHRTGAAPVHSSLGEGNTALSPELMRAIVAQAKTYEPSVPPELTEFIAEQYCGLRQKELEQEQAGEGSATYTTPRTLLSILRLSQACARLRFSNTVDRADVTEALRLMLGSKASLTEGGGAKRAADEDPVSLCYRLIREEGRRIARGQPPDRPITITAGRIAGITAKYGNITREVIDTCIQEYCDIAVWTAERDVDGNAVLHLDPQDIGAMV